MKINIICSENTGWIYAKFISMFRAYSKNQILLNSKERCDMSYCIPYYEFNDISSPCVVFLSHQEHRKDLYDKFIDAARAADFSIGMCKKYVDMIKGFGMQNITQIVPGVDAHRFALRTEERPTNKNKLIIGYIGRQYVSTDRKNIKLLEKISKLPFVDFRVTGGKIKELDMPKFYSLCDIIISPSKIEGGPMAILEGLTVGVPIICFEGVGLANEFGTGVLKVKFNDDNAFVARIKEFWDNKEHIKYRKLEIMQSLRRQTEEFTWENFVKQHDQVWANLIK